jgi:glyoxylase-like metal-dependent hydrolase (beta-lactamase superfamily II)
VIAVVHGSGEAGVANSALVVDGGTALVVDSMLLPEMAEDVVAEARRRGAAVTAVLNTHHHVDHVGGNAAFPGAALFAHPRAARIVRDTAGEVGGLGRIMPRFAAELRELAVRPPDRPLDELAVPRGGRLLAFTPAHSPADVALWLPAERVLLAGDLCFNRVVPLAVHGRLASWTEALTALIELRPAVVVPGHGPLAGVRELEALRDYLAAVLAAAAAIGPGLATFEEALAALDVPAVEGWIEPARNRVNLERALAEVSAG